MNSTHNAHVDDPLAPARGVISGVIFSLPFWGVVFLWWLL